MSDQEKQIQDMIDACRREANEHGERDSMVSMGYESVHALVTRLVGERDEAMKALANHNGRSWCAVCGFANGYCNDKKPDCIGSRARKMYPRKET
jgi:hypothetical protein